MQRYKEKGRSEVQLKYCALLFFSAEQPGNFHSVIVNDDLEKAYSEFKDIIHKVRLRSLRLQCAWEIFKE